MPKGVSKELHAARNLRRLQAEADLESFIALVHPNRWLGNVHREIIRWWDRQDAKRYQLLILPRDHMKSALVAYRVAWRLTKDPTLRVLYISSTSNLATKQLKFIKDIITSDVYRLYWPDMVIKEEANREKWTEREISVDHPLRKAEHIRDPSIFTAGLTSNIVGLHCDIKVLDDVVVDSNAYLEDGRAKVEDQYSLLSSIGTVLDEEWVVGTRYHPKDLYTTLMEREVETFNDVGEVIGSEPLFEIFRNGENIAVESAGDGTGEFIWPRTQRPDGKWFGFNAQVLAVKRGQYINKNKYRAQYYNNPNDIESSPFQRDVFQYFDDNFLACKDGKWFFKGNRLNVFAAVDFAFSLAKKADSTSIVVVGVDGYNNYYVLEIDRFKSDKISDYYNHILKLYEKWGFRKLRAETTVAQVVIVKDLKENYIRPNGLSLAVEEFKPTRWQGSKEERIMATLEPKYANRQIWHNKGGNCQTLEEELLFANPPHDDIKDALASVIDMAVPPADRFGMNRRTPLNNFTFNARFGGVA